MDVSMAPPSIENDEQAVVLLSKREELFVAYLTLTDKVEEINEDLYQLTCEIEVINKAFREALEQGKLSEHVLTALRNAVHRDEADSGTG